MRGGAEQRPRIGLSPQLPTTMTLAPYREAASIRAWAGLRSMTSTVADTPAASAEATPCSSPARPAWAMAS